jgi:O-antigen ligase
MRELAKKINDNKIICGIKKVLSSNYFPFVTAPVSLICYYLGWDIVIIYYLFLTTLFIIMFLDDMTPIISNFLFMNILVSKKNSPSETVGGSAYYFQTAIVAQLIALISILVIAIVIRFIFNVRGKRLKLNFTFWGLVALSVAMLANGLFSEGYTAKDLMYGLFMTFFLLGIYSSLQAGTRVTEGTFEKISLYFVALSIPLVIELAVAYATYDNLFIDGEINRNALMFGWGVYNTLGMLLVISLPPILYLAHVHKFGYIFFTYSIVVFFAVFLSTSRQAMIGGTIIYPVSLIVYFTGGKNRRINLFITAGILIILGILFAVFKSKIIDFFKTVFENFFQDGELNGSGRWQLWKDGIAEFKKYPVLGNGFYVDIPSLNAGTVGLSIIPLMYHNTFVQLLATSGIIGLATYVVHRASTVVSFVKNINYQRIYLALCILSLLIVNLFDNHLFYLFPTLIYSSLVAILVNSERK